MPPANQLAAETADIPFAEYCARVQRHLEKNYGIAVITRDIPDPLTGDLDGLQIHIDYTMNPEQRLFLLAHLFGHTVQWNIDPEAFELGKRYAPPVMRRFSPQSWFTRAKPRAMGCSCCMRSASAALTRGSQPILPAIRPICCTSIALEKR